MPTRNDENNNENNRGVRGAPLFEDRELLSEFRIPHQRSPRFHRHFFPLRPVLLIGFRSAFLPCHIRLLTLVFSFLDK